MEMAVVVRQTSRAQIPWFIVERIICIANYKQFVPVAYACRHNHCRHVSNVADYVTTLVASPYFARAQETVDAKCSGAEELAPCFCKGQRKRESVKVPATSMDHGYRVDVCSSADA